MAENIDRKDSIGVLLKERRNQLNLSIEDISTFTKLPIKTILILENDGFNDITESYYFIHLKNYAGILELDYEELKQRYLKEKQKGEEVVTFSVKKADTYRLSRESRKGVIYLILALVVIIIIVLAVRKYFTMKDEMFGGYSSRSFDTAMFNDYEVTTDSVFHSDEVEKTRPHKLTLRFRDPAWVRIQIDDDDQFQYQFQKGQTEEWYAYDSIRVSIGNASHVDISLDGESYPIEYSEIKNVINNHKIIFKQKTSE